MTNLAILSVLAVLATGLVFGGMAMFSFVIAPLVFRVLPRDAAAGFIRAAFPLYYATMAGAAALAAALAVFLDPVDAILLAAVAATFVALRQLLLPAINAHRERARAGDGAADAAFKRLHGASMAINLVQLAAAAVALARLAA